MFICPQYGPEWFSVCFFFNLRTDIYLQYMQGRVEHNARFCKRRPAININAKAFACGRRPAADCLADAIFQLRKSTFYLCVTNCGWVGWCRSVVNIFFLCEIARRWIQVGGLLVIVPRLLHWSKLINSTVKLATSMPFQPLSLRSIIRDYAI